MGASSATTRTATGPAKSAMANKMQAQVRGRCPPACRPVIDRVGVDVHTTKAVGAGSVEAAAEAARVAQRFLAVREAILDARLKIVGHPPDQRVTQVAANHVAAQWQGQTGLGVPPLP